MTDGVFLDGCWKCKTRMWVPQSLYDAAKKSSRISFFCAYGHEGIFTEAETEAQILRRERDRLKQQLAMKDDLIDSHKRLAEKAISELKATKASATKARKRTAAGVCPCCHRTFRQMALHMRNRHPEFKAEEAA